MTSRKTKPSTYLDRLLMELDWQSPKTVETLILRFLDLGGVLKESMAAKPPPIGCSRRPRGADLSLVHGRWEPARTGVPPVIVVLVDEAGHRGPGLRPGDEPRLGEQLELQGGVERLGDGVIEG